jgi:hypothetical protein
MINGTSSFMRWNIKSAIYPRQPSVPHIQLNLQRMGPPPPPTRKEELDNTLKKKRHQQLQRMYNERHSSRTVLKYTTWHASINGKTTSINMHSQGN